MKMSIIDLLYYIFIIKLVFFIPFFIRKFWGLKSLLGCLALRPAPHVLKKVHKNIYYKFHVLLTKSTFIIRKPKIYGGGGWKKGIGSEVGECGWKCCQPLLSRLRNPFDLSPGKWVPIGVLSKSMCKCNATNDNLQNMLFFTPFLKFKFLLTCNIVRVR